MSRRQKDSLRPLADDEVAALAKLSQSQAAPAVQVARAVILLAVARGDDYEQAALAAGRRSGDAVSPLVACLNAEGLAATSPTYDCAARERILTEVKRPPTPQADGTATWSLSTLRKALRSDSDGLPAVSTYTLWQLLHGAGYRHQLTRTWCPTGTPPRLGRRSSPTRMPSPKKGDRGRLSPGGGHGPVGLVRRPVWWFPGFSTRYPLPSPGVI